MKSLIILIIFSVMLSSCMTMMPFHHAMHSQGHSHDSHKTHYDPVCGNEVHNDSLNYKYMDNTYYFDSQDCLNVFKKKPEAFIDKQEANCNHNNNETTYWIIGSSVMLITMGAMMFFLL